MSISLKDINKPLLAAVLAGNAIAFYAFASVTEPTVSGLRDFTCNWTDLVPPTIVVLVTGILSIQQRSTAKARIVFGRWKNPLPGCQAYSVHAPADPRIGMADLTRLHGSLPTAPSDQNRHWYKLYTSVSADEAASQTHRDYLFARDYAASVLFLLPLGIAGGFVSFASTLVALGWTVALVAQFILARRAAAHHAIRLVQTVCALKAAGK